MIHNKHITISLLKMPAEKKPYNRKNKCGIAIKIQILCSDVGYGSAEETNYISDYSDDDYQSDDYQNSYQDDDHQDDYQDDDYQDDDYDDDYQDDDDQDDDDYDDDHQASNDNMNNIINLDADDVIIGGHVETEIYDYQIGRDNAPLEDSDNYEDIPELEHIDMSL